MRIKKYAVPALLLLAFAASAFWTLLLFLPPKEPVLAQRDVIIRYTPQYEIVSRKAVSLWPEGTVFEHGQPAYFYAVMPVISFIPIVNIDGIDRGAIGSSMQAAVSLMSVSDTGEVLWTKVIERFQPEVFELPPETAEVAEGAKAAEIAETAGQLRFAGREILLRLPELYEQARQFSDELQLVRAHHRIEIKVQMAAVGTVNGAAIDRSYAKALALSLEENSFSVLSEADAGFEDVLSRGPAGSADKWEPVNGADYWTRVMVTLGLFLLFWITLKLSRRTGVLEHRRYKEWITEGRVQTPDKPEIHVFSLAGLVDLAIDLEKRVIFDPSRSKYYLLEDSLIYIYDPDREADAPPEKRSKLGNLLVQKGLIKPEQLEIGLMYQRNIGSLLGESLVHLGFIDEVTLYSTLAAQANVKFMPLDTPPENAVDSQMMTQLTAARARILEAIPLGSGEDGKPVFACGSPLKKGIREALENLFGVEVEIVASTPSAIFKLIDAWESDTRAES